MSSEQATECNKPCRLTACVTFCDADGDVGKEEEAKQHQCAEIVALPYPLTERAALFRQMYGGCIGCSIEARRPVLGSLGINPGIVGVAIKKLGFIQIDEEVAEFQNFEPDPAKLHMLSMTSSKCSLNLGGPNYLIIKPFVGPMYYMVTKWFLVHSMRRIEERMRLLKLSFLTGSGRVFCHEEFTPFTLNLNNKCLEQILADQPGAYLAKPARGSMGQRQQLVHIHKDRVQEDLLDFLLTSQFRDMHRSQVILQRYVERPLLVDKRKFDLRVYMLVANAKRERVGERRHKRYQSGYFVFMHPGFLRLCTAPYDPTHTDLAVHLTNQSVQAKRTSTFSMLKEVTTWYPDELNQYLNKRKRLPKNDWAKDVLYPKVGAILGYVSAVFRRYLDDRDCPTNTFRILGVDFLVDDQLRVYLLEFNSHPSWGRQTSVLNHMKPNLWREAACLTSEVVLRYRARQPVRDDCLLMRQNFSLIYSSEDTSLARKNVARLYD